MSVLMFLQITLISERLITHDAGKWQRLTMYVPVVTCTTLATVRNIRHTTRIWMLLTVYELMFRVYVLEKKKMTTDTLKARNKHG